MNKRDQLDVLAHLRGEMTEEERRRFESRLAVDPGLMSASAKSAKLLQALERWEPRGTSADLAGDVMAKIAREPRHQPGTRTVAFPRRGKPGSLKRIIIPGAALAAAAAALVIWIGVSPRQAQYRSGETMMVMTDTSTAGAPESGAAKPSRPSAREPFPDSTILVEVPSLDTAEQEVRKRIVRLGAGQVRVFKRANTVVVEALVAQGADLPGALSGYGQLVSRNDAYRTADGRSVIVIRLRAR